MNNFKPCDSCGEEILPIGSYTACASCWRTLEIKRYNKLQLIEWDGGFPLAVFDDDKFLWSADDLWDHLESINSKDGDGVMLVACHPDNGPFVESASLFADHQPEDAEYVDQEIENAIAQLNRAIKKHAPYSWLRLNERVDCAKVVRFLQASKKAGEA